MLFGNEIMSFGRFGFIEGLSRVFEELGVTLNFKVLYSFDSEI